MNRFFIIEGPDASGKTSLAKRIAVMCGGTYLHMSGLKSLHDCMPAYHSVTLGGIEWTLKNVPNQIIVLDRSWPSEFVYGRIFRPQWVDTFPYKEFQDRIREAGGIYIFCRDEGCVERHRSNVNAAHPYTDEQYQQIFDGYEVLKQQMSTRPDIFHYNLLKDGPVMDDFIRTLFYSKPHEILA